MFSALHKLPSQFFDFPLVFIRNDLDWGDKQVALISEHWTDIMNSKRFIHGTVEISTFLFSSPFAIPATLENKLKQAHTYAHAFYVKVKIDTTFHSLRLVNLCFKPCVQSNKACSLKQKAKHKTFKLPVSFGPQPNN